MAKGASGDRLAHLSIFWRRTPGSPETACRQQWMTGLAGEKEPLGVSTEVNILVVVVVIVVVVVVAGKQIVGKQNEGWQGQTKLRLLLHSQLYLWGSLFWLN